MGIVKEQVGMAFTYPNIHLSTLFFWTDEATAVRISEGLLYCIVLFSSVVQSKRNGWWPKPLITFVRVYINNQNNRNTLSLAHAWSLDN